MSDVPRFFLKRKEPVAGMLDVARPTGKRPGRRDRIATIRHLSGSPGSLDDPRVRSCLTAEIGRVRPVRPVVLIDEGAPAGSGRETPADQSVASFTRTSRIGRRPAWRTLSPRSVPQRRIGIRHRTSDCRCDIDGAWSRLGKMVGKSVLVPRLTCRRTEGAVDEARGITGDGGAPTPRFNARHARISAHSGAETRDGRRLASSTSLRMGRPTRPPPGWTSSSCGGTATP